METNLETNASFEIKNELKNEIGKEDVTKVAKAVEKILDYVILKIVEQYIEKEDENGFLDKSKGQQKFRLSFRKMKRSSTVTTSKYFKQRREDDKKDIPETTNTSEELRDIYINDCKAERLIQEDFSKSGIELSKFLLGKILVHIINGCILAGRIVETEAYLGETDGACHTYGGKKTNRTKPMYDVAGTSYVYSIYGMYYCLNISSTDLGGCTLIRALEPIEGFEMMTANRCINNRGQKASKKLKTHQLCSGPSRLCQALNITKDNLNNINMSSSIKFFLVDDGYKLTDERIVSCKRIGIDGYGIEWASKPWRFYVLGNENVSKRDKEMEKTMSADS